MVGHALNAEASGEGAAARAWPLAWRLARFAAIVLIGYLVILLSMMLFEEALIFLPIRYPEGDWHPPVLAYEDVWFVTSDGLRLHGWFCPARRRSPVVLFSHGNAGNITHRTDELVVWQRRLDVAVFIYDYRGYGRSEGKPNEQGVYEDARGAYRWLTEQKGVEPDRILLRGKSLGSAVALQLALERPHMGLMLESAFTSAPDMGALLYPWLPVRWLMRTRFDNIAKIGRYRGPVLITHCRHDTIVPFPMGRQLFEAANEPKWFYTIKLADHNDLYPLIDEGYLPAIQQFIERCRGIVAETGPVQPAERGGQPADGSEGASQQ